MCFCMSVSSKCFHIVGPQCVPRRIYSIATGASRSQLLVAVEGTSACSVALTKNNYHICIHVSHLLLFMVSLDLSLPSESSCVCLQCCGPARACSLQGFDCQGRQVFHFERPLRVDACCFGCCLMELRAYTPQKHLIGTVYQR